MNCPDISQKRFTVQAPDPHGFDRDKDDIGYESYGVILLIRVGTQ
jgi:micrococcal nuclease